MTREEFDAWRAHPVTRWIFSGLWKAAAAEAAEWQRVSWGNGVANQRVLDQLRDRSSALLEPVENDFETWQKWNGEEHEPEE